MLKISNNYPLKSNYKPLSYTGKAKTRAMDSFSFSGRTPRISASRKAMKGFFTGLSRMIDSVNLDLKNITRANLIKDYRVENNMRANKKLTRNELDTIENKLRRTFSKDGLFLELSNIANKYSITLKQGKFPLYTKEVSYAQNYNRVLKNATGKIDDTVKSVDLGQVVVNEGMKEFYSSEVLAQKYLASGSKGEVVAKKLVEHKDLKNTLIEFFETYLNSDRTIKPKGDGRDIIQVLFNSLKQNTVNRI